MTYSNYVLKHHCLYCSTANGYDVPNNSIYPCLLYPYLYTMSKYNSVNFRLKKKPPGIWCLRTTRRFFYTRITYFLLNESIFNVDQLDYFALVILTVHNGCLIEKRFVFEQGDNSSKKASTMAIN